MLSLLINIFHILNTKQRLRIFYVASAGILTGLLEMLSIALFIPLVGLIIDKNYLERFEFLQIYILKLNEYTNLDIFYILIFILVIIFIVKNIIILGLNYYSDKSAYDTRKEIGNKIMQNYLQSNYEFYLIKDSSLIFYMLTEGVASFGHMLLSLMRLFTNILITIFIFIFILYHYPDQLILLSLSAFLGGGLYYFSQKILWALLVKEEF